MKKQLLGRAGLVVAVFLLTFNLSARAQSADDSPKAILDVMQRVADWQLANPYSGNPKGWVAGAGYDGFMALAGISGDAKYRDAMLAMAETNQWSLGAAAHGYHADDQCVGQTYAELYFLYRDPKMIAPLRARFDQILAHPSDAPDLVFDQKPRGKALELWSWCDSLFMAPPTWVRLYAATGDTNYLDFAVTNFWRTTDFLCDTNEHLFFRDSTYFAKHEANGQKVFWSRGNGWVMGGLVRILQYLPMNDPSRPRFEQLFKDMAAKILTCQQPDGLWHSSLLDPQSYPAKETSGSGFFTYAFAWGVNQGFLDRAQYEPAVQKAWTALVGCVNADGKLKHVQPVGADPKNFAEDSTEPYGVGAFLLAGSEVYRTAVLENTKNVHHHSSLNSSEPLNLMVKVSVTNPSNFRRDCETVEFNINPAGIAGNIDDLLWFPKGTAKVMDGLSSHILDSQIYATETNYLMPNKLLFQVDLAPNETRTFYILDASALPATPPPIEKTFARYVPERHDDFAWESDRIAHRIYGPDLETWVKEPLTSSGIDVWIKRTRNLVVNDMYASMKFFNIKGPAQDDYRVGKTRGDGGLGVWVDGTNYLSKNWRGWKVITTGPIRSEFVLNYDAWDVAGRKVSETKRISIDAGSNLSRIESTFTSDDQSPLTLGVGLAERPGKTVTVTSGSPVIAAWTNGTASGLVMQDQSEGIMTYWQPQDFIKGTIGVAILLPKDSIETYTNDKPNLPENLTAAPTHTLGEGQPAIRSLLALAPAKPGEPFVYYAGAGWSESGDFPNAAAWNDYIKRFAERRDQPLQVTVGN